MTAVTNIAIQAYLTYRGLFLWLNWPAYISNVFARPILTVATFALVGRFIGDAKTAQDFMVGLAAFSIPVIVLGGVIQVFYYERLRGTLSIVFASTGSRLAIYFSRGALHTVNGLITAGLSLGFSALFLHLDVSNVDFLAMACALLLIAISTTAFGLFLGSMVLVVRDWFYFLSSSQGLLISLTGVIIPIDALPIALRVVSRVLPMTSGLEALRHAFDGAGIGQSAGLLTQEMVVAIAFAIVGCLVFQRFEITAKRRGTLEQGA